MKYTPKDLMKSDLEGVEVNAVTSIPNLLAN